MESKIPELTLTPDLTEEVVVVEKAPVVAEPEAPQAPDLSSLTSAERVAVMEFIPKIDLTDSGMVLQYGAAAQKNMADFSETTLSTVRTKDMGELGDMIGSLVTELKGFSAEEEEKKGFLGLFRRAAGGVQSLVAKYEKAEANVDKIACELQDHQVVLFRDIALLDEMYEKNLEHFKQLSMYILAGEQKLYEERQGTLKDLFAKAEASGLPEDAQKANDYAALCDRFEKKIYDLKLTRQISLQMGPQIRMVQNNDTIMTEKIQTSLVNTIPLWKSQMVLALGISHSKQAMEAQRAVSDMTNELLKKNAEMLKLATVETAKESERGIVDIETLQATNQTLISTLDEVVQIQNEGRMKRREAEATLTQIEGELKQKLLEARR